LDRGSLFAGALREKTLVAWGSKREALKVYGWEKRGTLVHGLNQDCAVGDRG